MPNIPAKDITVKLDNSTLILTAKQGGLTEDDTEVIIRPPFKTNFMKGSENKFNPKDHKFIITGTKLAPAGSSKFTINAKSEVWDKKGTSNLTFKKI